MTPLTFPKIDGMPVAEVPPTPAAGASRPLVEMPVTVDVWDYFVENIDEFAVAKSIVDHIDDFPEVLNHTELDYRGLYLRAKVTLKRRQIAYVEAQEAIEQARARTRSIRGRLQAFSGLTGDLVRAIAADRTCMAFAVVGVLVYLLQR